MNFIKLGLIFTVNLAFIGVGMACDDPCLENNSGLQSYHDSTMPIGTYKCVCMYNCQIWNPPSGTCIGVPRNDCGGYSPDMDSPKTIKNSTDYNYDPYSSCKPATTYCQAICKSGCKDCIA